MISPSEISNSRPAGRRMDKFNTWFAFSICILAGVSLLYFSVTYYLRSSNLQKNGVETTAQIEAGKQMRSVNGTREHYDNTFLLAFTTADGKPQQVQMNVPIEVYRKVTDRAQQESSTARIRYLPSNPQIVDLVGADRERNYFIIFCGVTGLLLSLYGIYGFRLRRKHSDLSAAHNTRIPDW